MNGGDGPAGWRAGLQQASHQLSVETRGARFNDVTNDVRDWLRRAGARKGLAILFLRHTSASLTIQENADPDVLADLMECLDRFAPETHPYAHASESPDDMPAHIKAMLTATNLAIPVQQGRMMLGTWQGIYLIEHRAQPHLRAIALHYLGTFNKP